MLSEFLLQFFHAWDQTTSIVVLSHWVTNLFKQSSQNKHKKWRLWLQFEWFCTVEFSARWRHEIIHVRMDDLCITSRRRCRQVVATLQRTDVTTHPPPTAPPPCPPPSSRTDPEDVSAVTSHRLQIVRTLTRTGWRHTSVCAALMMPSQRVDFRVRSRTVTMTSQIKQFRNETGSVAANHVMTTNRWRHVAVAIDACRFSSHFSSSSFLSALCSPSPVSGSSTPERSVS